MHTIALASKLPQITQPLQIDGTTQAGTSCGTLVPTDANGVIRASNTPHALMVEVTTKNIPNTQAGVVFDLDSAASNTLLKGLVINGSQNGDDLIISRASNTTIECSYIGTNVQGDGIPSSVGVAGIGLYAPGTNAIVRNNLIGSSGTTGIYADASDARIEANIIGLDKTGSTPLPQAWRGESAGVKVDAPRVDVTHNIIGGYDNAINGSGASELKIRGNYLGVGLDEVTTTTGVLQRWAIRYLNDSDNVTIGGTTDADRNVIARGEGDGIRLEGTSNAHILGNYLGLGADGATPLQRQGNGINLISTAQPVIENNTIVNSSSAGINRESSCSDLLVSNNYIGVTRSGSIQSNDGIGIVAGCSSQIIRDNVVSGNNGDGIKIDVADATTILTGNIIGLKPDGMTPAPNGQSGISANQSGALTIGGSQASDRNIIASNGRGQIRINADSTVQRVIQGNYICLDKNGSAVAGGSGAGINLNSGAGNVMVGGSQPGEGNVISCGKDNSSILQDVVTNNPIYYYGNIIGLKPDGETPAWPAERGSEAFAILLRGDSPTHFGGAATGQGNIVAATSNTWGFGVIGWPSGTHTLAIKGNKYGITKGGQSAGNYGPIQVAHIGGNATKGLIIGGDSEADGNDIANTKNSNAGDYGAISYGDGLVIGATEGTVVKHNSIWGNDRNGVTLYGDTGGNAVIERNEIHDNGALGIGISQGYDQGSGPALNQTGNTIRFNKIYKNAAQGIDLGGFGGDYVGNFDGMRANDGKDADTGPNMLQNYPVIKYNLTACDGTTKEAPGGFNSTPNTTFTLDYYTNPSWKTGDPLQGETWVSSETVTTDANGDATFNLPQGLASPTITATDPQGNTSEFGVTSIMSLSDCQDMNQRTVADTQNNLSLNALWAGIDLPDTYYRNQPEWPNDYDQTTEQWKDNIQKSGLQVAITVGGQALLYDEPSKWSYVYSFNNNSWTAYGHLATSLPEGTYDVVLTLTDPSPGLSMTHTYKDAVKVALPKISYTTTITNSQTPTLQGTASDVDSLYSGYIVPAGTVIDANNAPKQRLLVYAPDTDADGRQLSTGKWQILTNKDQVVATVTKQMTNQKDQELQYYTSGKWAQDSAGSFYGLSGADPSSVRNLADFQSFCTSDEVQQRIRDWWGATITSEQDCRDWIQQRYDIEYSQTAFYNDENLRNFLDSMNSSNPPYETTLMPEGKYDVYISGSAMDGNNFTKSFPEGLIIDLSKPTAAVTTDHGATSPELTGTVSDPAATVKVTINGKTYTAINRGDGTWFIATGIIAPLTPGIYNVTVEVTNLAGTATTTTSKLTVQQATEASSNTPGGQVGKVQQQQALLSPTGAPMILFAGIAGAMLLAGKFIIWRLLRKKQ